MEVKRNSLDMAIAELDETIRQRGDYLMWRNNKDKNEKKVSMSTRAIVANGAIFLAHWILYFFTMQIAQRNLESAVHRLIILALGFFVVTYGLMVVRRRYSSLFE